MPKHCVLDDDRTHGVFIGSCRVAQMSQYHANPHTSRPFLATQMYFFAIPEFWIVLGAIAILAPHFPRPGNGHMPASSLTQ